MRLNILRQDAENTVLAPLRTHGWDATIEREDQEGDGQLVIVAARRDATRRAALLYSSGTDNRIYKRLETEVDVILFRGQPYMVQSFTAGVTKPVKALDDFHLILVDWNRETSDTLGIAQVLNEGPTEAILEPRRFLSETPIDAIWARLSQLRSATLARKMIAQRALVERVTLDANDIASKGEGVAFAVRNAIDYFAPKETHNVSQRVLNLYYGSLSFAFAELLASPKGSRTLAELEGATKQGHGLYTLDGLKEGVADFTVGALKSGFFARWAKALSADPIVAVDQKPKKPEDLAALPAHSWFTLEQLFARIPELADIYVDVFDGSPAWLRAVYHQASNARPGLHASGQKPTASYVLLIDGSGRLKAEDVQAFPGPLREITQVASGSNANHFRVAVDHPDASFWYEVLPLHRSPFERSALTLPLYGTLQDYRATCVVILYALSILVRYRPGLWRRIQEGDLDHFRALIETFLTIVERMLPQQFLETIIGQPISVHQPGSFFS
ncbi:YaaC family protein [Dyella sp. Tek66A03]|uniref:YaaC family protein n=1 Tax=Dyella sp. Tek66A03 TaxID=3458298 RepID=UPI00403EB703